MSILVCPLSRVQDLAVEWKPTRVISVLDPHDVFPDVSGVSARRHLRLAFHDAHHPGAGVTLATSTHLHRLLGFLKRCSTADRVLIHCRAGIGRSTAGAFIVACYQYPAVSELDIARALRQAAPFARPNMRFVRLADLEMARGGRMAAAIEETGYGLPSSDILEGDPFELEVSASL